MPETFLLFRFFFEYLGYTDKWRSAMSSLSDGEKDIILPIIFKNNFSNIEEMNVSDRIKSILSFYKNYRAEIADPNSELFKMKQEFEKKRIE